MGFLLLLPCVLSFWLLAAHFCYGPNQSFFLAALSALMPALLFIRVRYVLRSMQLLLLIAALEWVRAMLQYVDHRMAHLQPFRALVIILTSVALFNLLAAALFQTRRLKARYPKADRRPPAA